MVAGTGTGDSVVRITYLRIRIIEVLFALLVVGVFAGQLHYHNLAVQIISALCLVLGIAGAIRGSRSGSLVIANGRLRVRTVFRAHTFALKDITSVEACYVVQTTARVFPVLHLSDGTTYKMSEFFVQRQTYTKHKDSCIVTRVVEAIAGVL